MSIPKVIVPLLKLVRKAISNRKASNEIPENLNRYVGWEAIPFDFADTDYGSLQGQIGNQDGYIRYVVCAVGQCPLADIDDDE